MYIFSCTELKIHSYSNEKRKFLVGILAIVSFFFLDQGGLELENILSQLNLESSVLNLLHAIVTGMLHKTWREALF